MGNELVAQFQCARYSRTWMILSITLSLVGHAICELQPSHIKLTERIKQQHPDFKPEGIVDVGANRGVWSHTVYEMVYPNATYVMVEATPKQDEFLKEVIQVIGPKQAEFYIEVLTARDGDSINFFQDGDTGNSMFQEQTKHYVGHKPVPRKSRKLDTLLKESMLAEKDIDIIKVDVQGAELLVLQGATETLSKATFVQFEGSTIEYNKGAACTFEVDEFLRSQGYYFYDIASLSYNIAFKTPALGQYDVLYVRPASKKLPATLLKEKPVFCGQNSNRVDAASESAAPDFKSHHDNKLVWAPVFFSGTLFGVALSVLLRPMVLKMGKSRGDML